MQAVSDLMFEFDSLWSRLEEQHNGLYKWRGVLKKYKLNFGAVFELKPD